MNNRKQQNANVRGNFSSSIKKPAMQNQQNRNRFSGGMGNNSSSFLSQVNPWLPQSNIGGFGNLGRNISDPQAQLALASDLINNLLGANSQLNKFVQPPSLLSLGNLSASSSLGGSSFNRDRFNIPRTNVGKVQKRGNDFRNSGKNKRFGNERKNQGAKKDQINKKVTGESNAEKKDVSKNEENKVEKTDLNQSVSDKEEKFGENDSSTANINSKESQKSADDEPKVSYLEVPFAFLFCHVCRKHMWDDVSFEKHLVGKPHKMMVEELERTYELKVALLRHEMRVMEQQRENDIQRAFRKGKSKTKLQQRGFCTMCDLNFLGMLPAHRKNERHQRLKKFLHPKCSACAKEFYTRLEWDDHKLSPNHLKKLAEIMKETRPDLENSEFDIIDFIEDINDELEAEVADIKVSGKREMVDELKAVKSESNAKDESSVENKESITDENFGTVKSTNEEVKKEHEKEEKFEEDEESKRLPKFVVGNPVGENFLMEKKGYLCRACNRFMLNREDNKTHCQTVTHYNNVVKILKVRYNIGTNKRPVNAPKNEDEEKGDDVEDSTYEIKAKRLKLEEDDYESVTETIVKEEPVAEESIEKYDPEDSGSEPEKDDEKKLIDEEPKPPAEVEPVIVKSGEVTVDIPKIDAKLEPVKEVKKPARPNKARRGRRN